MRYEGPDGQKGEPSAEAVVVKVFFSMFVGVVLGFESLIEFLESLLCQTDAVQLDDAMRSAKAAQEFLRHRPIGVW